MFLYSDVGTLLVWPNCSWLLLFAMIRSVVKSFKVSDVDVVAALMSNESVLTPKNLGCCCCMPSETYGKNGPTQIFRSFHRTASSTTF